jgi:hypothetical protein
VGYLTPFYPTQGRCGTQRYNKELYFKRRKICFYILKLKTSIKWTQFDLGLSECGKKPFMFVAFLRPSRWEKVSNHILMRLNYKTTSQNSFLYSERTRAECINQNFSTHFRTKGQSSRYKPVKDNELNWMAYVSPGYPIARRMTRPTINVTCIHIDSTVNTTSYTNKSINTHSKQATVQLS